MEHMFSMKSASNVRVCVKTARLVTNQQEIVIMDAMIIGLENFAMVCCFIFNLTIYYVSDSHSLFFQRFILHAMHRSVFIIYILYIKTKIFKAVRKKMFKIFVFTVFEINKKRQTQSYKEYS